MQLAKFFSRHCRKIAGVLLAMFVAIVVANVWMIEAERPFIYTDIRIVPTNSVGLVLGTAPFTFRDNPNLHFTARINAAAQLFKTGRVQHLLLSGDNDNRGYDEPTEMKKALLKLGVPETAMTLDYAGFRTLDSMERARKVFDQTKVTIITEPFHAARSVFLARHFGLEPVVYCAERLPAAWNRPVQIREAAARVLAVLDIYVWHHGARRLGEKIPIQF